MSEECGYDCSSCGESCADRQQESLLAKPHELSCVKKVIAIVSGKGGVGKSLLTALMAVLAQRNNYKTAVFDADITGPSIPKMFGLTAKAEGDELGIHPVRTKLGIEVMSLNLLIDDQTTPVIWRGPIIAGTVKQFWTDVIWGDIDFMFVDLPPGTGDVPLTVFQSLPVDGIIIVASPQELVSMIVEKAVNMAATMKVPILGLVENMSYLKCPDCNKIIRPFGESHIAEVGIRHNIPVLGQMPIEPLLADACDKGIIELFNEKWLDGLAEKLEQLLWY